MGLASAGGPPGMPGNWAFVVAASSAAASHRKLGAIAVAGVASAASQGLYSNFCRRLVGVACVVRVCTCNSVRTRCAQIAAQRLKIATSSCA